jgi:hypothetical protein
MAGLVPVLPRLGLTCTAYTHLWDFPPYPFLFSIVGIGRIDSAWGPVWGIAIIVIHIIIIAPLTRVALLTCLPVDQVRIVVGGTSDVLARLVDIYRVVTNPGDGLDGKQKLRFSQA